MSPPFSNKLTWQTYGIWSFWVAIAFFSVYPTCNWLSSLHDTTYPLYLTQELAIPFVAEFIWLYLSMYLLLLLPVFFLSPPQLKRLGQQLICATIASGLIFLILPTQLGFERVLPESAYYAAIYAHLFAIDLPHNMVPSLHVVFSAIILLSLIESKTQAWFKGVCYIWLVLICIATLLVHQHHLLDVMTGLLLTWIVRNLLRRNPQHG